MSLAAQLPVLGLAVFVAGTPHGALDHRAARSLLEPALGRGWMSAFVLLYLGAAGAMLLWWLAAPGAALAAFLILATVHFGSHDSPSGAPLAVVARGAVPPVVAAAAHRDGLATIFGWIAGEQGAALVPWLAGPGLALWLCAAVGTLALERSAGSRLELIGVTAAFLFLPPLLAFAAYFALLHSPRALRTSLLPGETAGAMLRSALPWSLAAVGLAALGYLLLRDQLPADQAFVRTVFWWLAALTVPHMGLHLLSRRNSPIAIARSSPG
uniref:Brp/Blh family beta-carotene 15,15'-dioxygenase n=1 Tax=uncultured Sphingomonas sp. TaxID=158754 RepID=UPI0025D99A49|nr:Brp/Blh family beta-carotene 15,15'-dioxygenase [uncultured Sphingomonas sp.]